MDLTELERAVLAKLLAGDHHLLEQLRAQIPCCRVTGRELSGVGFFTHLDVVDSLPADDVNLRISDVIAEVAGLENGAGFLLYVDHGRLTMLEGYCYTEHWPDPVAAFTLRYMAGDDRDWAALEKQLGYSDR